MTTSESWVTRIGEAVAATRAALAAAGIETAVLDARLLVGEATGLTREGLISGRDQPLSIAAERSLAERLQRRLEREPLAYIVGEREFWSLPFTVDRRVLVPRPDSETLVEAALAWVGDRQRPLRILDLGTGSGCLLLALLSELPAAWGLGIDISGAALQVARANAARLGLAPRTAFLQGDWASAIDGRFDLVVTNPPYVTDADWSQLAPEITRHEPRLALVAGADGLGAYRRIVRELGRLLDAAGAAFVELGAGQFDSVVDLAASAGLHSGGGTEDLAGVVRCVQLRSIN